MCFLKNNFKYKNIYKWGGKLEDGSEKLQTFSYKVISTRDVMHNTAVCYTQTLLREYIMRKNLFSISLILHLFEMMDIY